ncbi:hypothetical protein GIB67_007583 [Kingdonia uniflora]|uniref:Uncharacterized protein n=1 Tax=Kingdonia uniflora TaxID=39325 RepID=A0A7J7N1Q0_9MAGN|nr:hypothetical protein GIB67_007583 [Kingdonia uniflora]
MALKGCHFEHTCTGKVRSENKLANALWIANEIEELVRDVKTLIPKDVQTTIGRKYGVNVSYYTAWNAKTICIKRITGLFDDGYNRLPELTRQEFPHQNHMFCFRHMWKNIKKDFRGSYLERLCWGVAKAFVKDDKQVFLDKLQVDNPEAKRWLDKELAEYWCKSHFNFTAKCEHITNNFLESFNNWILKIIDKPLDKLIEGINLMMMKLTYDRREKAQGWDQNFVVPRAKIHIKRIKRYCSEYHMVSSYVKTYSGSILAISDPSLWDKTMNIEVLPLLLVRGAVSTPRGRGGRGTNVRGRGNSQTGRSGSGITEARRGRTEVVRGRRGNTQPERGNTVVIIGGIANTQAGRGSTAVVRGRRGNTQARRGNTAAVRGGRGYTQARRGGRGNTVVVRGGRGTVSLSQ